MIVLAAASSSSAWVQPGTLGFLVVFGMAVILYFVFKSMSRHLRKVNEAARAEEAAREAAERQAGKSDADVTASHWGNGPSGDS